MNKQDQLKQAMLQCKNKYECKFDDRTFVIRRNLLFVSMLCVLAILIQPTDGAFNVNLGIVTGKIQPPEIVYIGLAGICLYELFYLWISCQEAVVRTTNYGGVNKVFFNELASITAYAQWNEITKVNPGKKGLAIGTFLENPITSKSAKPTEWAVRGEINLARLKENPTRFENVEKAEGFSVTHSDGIAHIDFTYIETAQDTEYLNIHRNHFWTRKRKEWVDLVAPMLFGFVVIVVLALKAIL